MLHRCPDRQSAACVIWASYPCTHLRCEGAEGSEGSKGSEGGRLRAQIIKKGASLRRRLHRFCSGGGEKGSYFQKSHKKELPKEFSFFILIRMRSSVRCPRCRRGLRCCRMLWLRSCSKRPVLRSSGVLRLRELPRSERRTRSPSRNPAGR